MAARDELDIPMPSMAPSYRVQPRKREDMDPATKRLLVFAGVIGAALFVLVGVWSFTGRHHATVPVIEADSRPMREKPANPGGLQVDGATDPLSNGDVNAKTTVAPLPETPAPQALQAQEQASAAAAAAPQAAPAAGAAATTAQTTVRPELQPLPALRPHITVTTPKPAASAQAPVATQAAAKPMAMAQAAAPQAAVPAARSPAPQPLAAPQARVAPAPASAPAAVPPAKSLLAASKAAPAAGSALVQLAALKTEADANAEWARLTHKYPDLLGGRRAVISKTEHGGNTYWRLRTAGFADASQATAFCDQIKGKGAGCTVAHF